MQKVMVCLKRPVDTEADDWNSSVKEFLLAEAKQFQSCGYAIKDQDVAAAHLLELKYTAHPSDAVITIWLDHAHKLDDFFTAVADLGQFQAYGVMESSAIPIETSVGRVEGMCQVAFIKKPATQPRQEWLDFWLNDHTRVAIDTQSSFGYRQNVVCRANAD